jgi:hypothetical protein
VWDFLIIETKVRQSMFCTNKNGVIQEISQGKEISLEQAKKQIAALFISEEGTKIDITTMGESVRVLHGPHFKEIGKGHITLVKQSFIIYDKTTRDTLVFWWAERIARRLVVATATPDAKIGVKAP